MGDEARTTSPLVHIDADEAGRLRAGRSWVYRGTVVALSAIIVGALLDAAGVYPVYGVDSSHAEGSGGGYDLDVRYATVSRPALATPFDIEVRRPGGFDGPVTVAVSSDYLAMWDENGLDPSPSKETATPDTLVWEFDPPAAGEALAISFDARIEPAAQQGKRGTVAVLDPSGSPLVSVSFRTRLRP